MDPENSAFLFIFTSPLLLLILFQTKQLLLLDTYSANTHSPFRFSLSRGKSWRSSKKGCQAPSVYRPGLESCSKRKHSWHPVQAGLALSNYLASLVKYQDLGMRPLTSLPCGDSQVELSYIPSPSVAAWCSCFIFPFVCAALWFLAARHPDDQLHRCRCS